MPRIALEDFNKFINNVLEDKDVVVLTENIKVNNILNIFQDFMKDNRDLSVKNDSFITSKKFALVHNSFKNSSKPYGPIKFETKVVAATEPIVEKFFQNSFYTKEEFEELLNAAKELVSSNLEKILNEKGEKK